MQGQDRTPRRLQQVPDVIPNIAQSESHRTKAHYACRLGQGTASSTSSRTESVWPTFLDPSQVLAIRVIIEGERSLAATETKTPSSHHPHSSSLAAHTKGTGDPPARSNGSPTTRVVNRTERPGNCLARPQRYLSGCRESRLNQPASVSGQVRKP